MKSFSELSYMLNLPSAVLYSDRIVIKTVLKRRPGNTEHIMPYKARLVDKLNREYTWAEGSVIGSFPKNLEYVIPIKNKPIMKDLKMYLQFLSESGMKGTIEYSFENSEKTSLVDVSVVEMSELEKELYMLSFQNLGKELNEELKGQSEGANHNAETEDIDESENDFAGTDFQKYIDALVKEKWYLKQEGGREYKVTNGKLIGNSKGIYSYIFDLETELHLSDDAPITLTSGVEEVAGSVLMCEDFQIIVLLDKNIGEKVLSARINVEPWKLLESLEKRLVHSTSINRPITQLLINKGPQIATKDKIESIPKGQDEVIARAVSEPITIVWGPPGTGKTHTMSEIAIRFLKEGKSVLIVSHSNVSVDGVAKKIYELLKQKGESQIYENGQVLRYGYVRDDELNENPYVCSFRRAVKQCPQLDAKLEELQKEYVEIKRTYGIANQKVVDIHKEISKIRSQIRDEEIHIVAKARVIATTISKVVIDKIFDARLFDVVMFDEVSMAYVPQIVSASSFAKEHFICVGDFMQLSPIAQSSQKEILTEDIFGFLGINVKGVPYYHPWLVMLDEQRRMHPDISMFANKYVYQGMLKDHESVSSRGKIAETAPFAGSAINLIDLTGCYCAASKNQDNSRYNVLSAFISFASALKAEQSMEEPAGGSLDERVSIITPYAAQTRLIRALIQDYREHNKTSIRCATVHQFQGSESNMIVFDGVESYPGSKVGYLMGKEMNSIKRLINVAVTRARGKLITVSNAKFWENAFKGTNHTYYRLQQYLIDNGNHVRHIDESLEKHIEVLDAGKMLRFYLRNEYSDQISDDFAKAKQKVVISLPSGNLDAGMENEIYELVKTAKLKGIHVLIKSNDYASLPDRWKEFTWGTDNAVFPIIMIDDHTTWYGVPKADWKFQVDKSTSYKTVCPIAVRVKGEYTAEMIKSLSNLEFRETAGGISPLVEKDSTTSVLSHKNEDGDDDGKGASGLAAYIERTKKCSKCKKSMKLLKSKAGKPYLKCSDKNCDGHNWLDIGDVEHYICANHIVCQEHKCGIEAKLGPYGLYIKCDMGHYIKPDQI